MEDEDNVSIPGGPQVEEGYDDEASESVSTEEENDQEQSLLGSSDEESSSLSYFGHTSDDSSLQEDSDGIYHDDDGEQQLPARRKSSRVIAIGLPSDQVEAAAGIPIPNSTRHIQISDDDSDEGLKPPHRHLRSPSDANQEAVSEMVAESIAEQEHNEKQGIKKTTPPAAATAATGSTNVTRRESSVRFGDKNHLNTSATSGVAPSGLKREATTGSILSKDGSSVNVSMSFLGDEQVSEELEAQAGIPVVLPGAFAIEGIDSSHPTGYDSGFDGDESDHDDEASSPDYELGLQEQSRREALPAELHPSERQLVAGEAVVTDDGARRTHILRGRLLWITIVVGVVAVFSAVLAAVLVSRNNNSSNGKDLTDANGWEQVGEDIVGPTTDDNVEFGHAVSLSADGQRFAVGLPGWDDGSSRLRVGQARVFDWNGTHWILSTPGGLEGPGVGAEAGSSVAMASNGQRVAVGSPLWETRGHVAVYQATSDDAGQVSTTWSPIGDELLGDASDNGQFGSSVALSADGGILAVGSSYLDGQTVGEDSGVLRVFQIRNSTWSQLGQDIEGESMSDLFGWSVAISSDGERLIAGAVGSGSPGGAADFTGQARIFTLEGSEWVQLGQTIYGSSAQDRFGHSVSMSDDGLVVAVGINSQRTDPGYVRVFQYGNDPNEWVQLGDDILGENNFDSFGYSVGLSADGKTLAAGGPYNDNSARDAGQVRVFNYNDDTTSWIQKLGDIDGSSEGDQFGWSVSLSADGNRLASGAPFADFDGRVFNVGNVVVHQVEDSVVD